MKNSKLKLQRSLSRISVLSLLTVLAGCASAVTPLGRSLPSQPAFAQTVQVSPAQAGESCYISYDRQKSGRERANSIIIKYNNWYASVKKNYSAKDAAR